MNIKLTAHRVTVAGIALAAVVSAASAQAQSRAGYEAYAIIDFQTEAPKAALMDAAERALRNYATDLNTQRPIAIQTPETPGRFELVNPLAGSRMAGLAALGGVSVQQFRTATCEGAIWTANVDRRISGSQELRAVLCLFPYANDEREGYHLNLYANDAEVQGGGIGQRLGRALAGRVVGTPREFTENMLRETVSAIEAATDSSAVLIEGEPEIPGLAWRR